MIHDARWHGITTLPVDVRLSQYKCIPEQGAIRLGLNYVKGFGEAAAERIIEARQGNAFHDLSDFCKRTKLPHLLVENLIQAGAFQSLG